MILHSLFLILLPALLFAESVAPQPGEKEIFLGEPLILTVPVRPGKEISAALAEESANFSLIRTEPAGERIRITLSALETGALRTPPIVLRNDGAELRVEPVDVTVKPNTTESETQLRDIKPPAKAYEADHTLLWIVGGALAVAALFLLFWRLSKRRRKQVVIPVAQKTPYQLALEYRRRAEQQLQEMDYEAFADTVTAGLRHYLELVKHRPFLEMTTGEIRRALKKSDVAAEDAERIVAFLADADRFKYADEAFTSDRFSAFLDEFSRIVDKIERSRSVSTLPGSS